MQGVSDSARPNKKKAMIVELILSPANRAITVCSSDISGIVSAAGLPEGAAVFASVSAGVSELATALKLSPKLTSTVLLIGG